MAQVAVEFEGGKKEQVAESTTSGWDWVTNAVSSVKGITGDVKTIVGDIKGLFSDDVAAKSVSGGSSAKFSTTDQSMNIILLAIAALGIVTILK